MTFSLQENYEDFSGLNRFEIDTAASSRPKSNNKKIHIFAEQLRVPELENYIPRPRLDELAQNSLNKIGAILITGRAGTGKTAFTANFAKNYRRVVWYRVEAADAGWEIFSSYLYKGIFKKSLKKIEENITASTEKLFGDVSSGKSKTPGLIVLDDIHHVFDAKWFDDFFTTAIYSLPPEIHLIFLARSKPVCPLWRLRSKQVLTVIDEKMLIFNQSETENFCTQNGVAAGNPQELHKNSSGKIGKLKTLVNINV